MQDEMTKIRKCFLCPRNCGADRAVQGSDYGRCHVSDTVRIARAALHMWEEPCISGEEGSGTVFFSGCSLGCVFCQNRDISGGVTGKDISVQRLSEIFLELQEKHANNINLVTPGHYVPQIAGALRLAKENGLKIPIVYNTGSYEKTETLRMLEGLVDIYLPDFKYMSEKLAKKYSDASDYAEKAKSAVAEMGSQAGTPRFDDRGMMKKGVIVRHLVLPGNVDDSKAVIRYLYETYKDDIFVSIMNQYTPMPGIEADYPELGRKVTEEEYEDVVDYAIELGVENGFIQEGETAQESFIPPFDLEGV